MLARVPSRARSGPRSRIARVSGSSRWRNCRRSGTGPIRWAIHSGLCSGCSSSPASARAKSQLARRRWILEDVRRSRSRRPPTRRGGRTRSRSRSRRSHRRRAAEVDRERLLFSTTAGAKPVRLQQGEDAAGPFMGERWAIHDLRRSVATHMARLGVPQEHIERVLGHVIEGVAGLTTGTATWTRSARHWSCGGGSGAEVARPHGCQRDAVLAEFEGVKWRRRFGTGASS